MDERVLVTGATGLLGQHLCRALLDQEFAVRALVRQPQQQGFLPRGVEIAVGDIKDFAQVRSATKSCSVILHACCTHVYNLPREEVRAINVQGTLNICSAAEAVGCRRLVFTSTFSTFHAARSPDSPAEVPARRWNTVTKQMAEDLVLKHVQRGLPAVIVNPAYFVGPFDYNPSPFRLWVPLAIRRRVRWVPGGGFNVVHAGDVANAHLWALRHGTIGERHPVTGHNVSLVDYVRYINGAAGHPYTPKTLPASLLAYLAKGRVFDAYASQMLSRSNYVNNATQSPVLVQSVESIVRDTVAWFKERRRLTDILPMVNYVWQRYI